MNCRSLFSRMTTLPGGTNEVYTKRFGCEKGHSWDVKFDLRPEALNWQGIPKASAKSVPQANALSPAVKPLWTDPSA